MANTSQRHDFSTNDPSKDPCSCGRSWLDHEMDRLNLLGEITEARRAEIDAQRRLWDAVEAARADLTISWEHIGRAIGTTRQSAQERFSKPAPGRLT